MSDFQGEPMQMRLGDREKLKGQIGTALLKLRPAGQADPPAFSDYCTGWNRPQEVPDELWPRVLKVLEAELDCRQRFGDAAYFAAKPLAAKMDIYFEALVATQESFLQEFIKPEDPVAWVEFKLRFAEKLKERMVKTDG